MSEHDPLEDLYEVPAKTSAARIEALIYRAFEGVSRGLGCAKACNRPAAFNLLLGWVPGDERWPIAALLLQRGLTIKGTGGATYEEIATLVNRSTNAVNAVVGSRGMKSVYRKIKTAWELMGKKPRRNELRFDLGLPTGIWMPLAKNDVRTIASLQRVVNNGSVRQILRCGEATMAKVTTALEGHTS